MDYVFFGLTVLSILPFSHYYVRYTGWKYPQFHQDDLQKMYVWAAMVLCFLVLTVVAMANS